MRKVFRIIQIKTSMNQDKKDTKDNTSPQDRITFHLMSTKAYWENELQQVGKDKDINLAKIQINGQKEKRNDLGFTN